MTTGNAMTVAPMQPIVTMPVAPYFDEDGITIYNVDSKKILPWLPPVDLLLTDPPYGIGMAKRGTIGTSKAGKVKDYGKSDWDDATPPAWFLDSATKLAGTSILWGGNYYEGLPPSSCWLVWDKDNTGDFADCELAWTNMPKAVRKFKWRWNGMIQEHGGNKKEPRVHPTQKPLALMRWCLSLVPEAKTVLDPFMGAGTTLVAARLEGRKAIGIEISGRYCESAVKRLAQKTLF